MRISDWSSDVCSSDLSSANLLDIRNFAEFVSVAVDETNAEHWLLSDGHWVIRLDLHDGTLLGGPLFLDYQIGGLADTGPKISALQQIGRASCRERVCQYV